MMNPELLESQMKQLAMFISQYVKIDPLPEVIYLKNHNDADDFLIFTGCYDGNSQTITLSTDGRHIKDVLRSYAHELMHHAQYLKNPGAFDAMNIGGKLCENDELRRIEGDAYLNGNLLFRMWTESLK